jgi:vitamin B12 transporter
MKKGLLMVLALTLPALPLAAEDSGNEAEEVEEGLGEPIVFTEPGPWDYIVVEGGLISRPLSDRADPVRYVYEPDQGGGIRVESIIRDIPGFQQFRRSDARSANPTSQGLTSRGLGGNAASRTLLILDGIPQSDPFGGWVNWTAFDAVKLRGLRIVEGGGSGADGPGALAGTIQMSSEASGESHFGVAYGSRNSIDADANANLDVGYGSIIIGGNYSRGGGFIPIVASQRGPVDGRAKYESYGLGVRFVVPFSSNGSRDGVEATIRAFGDNRSRGLPFSDNRNNGVDASIRVLDRSIDVPWMALAYVQLREFSSQFNSVAANRASVTPTLDQFDVPSTGVGGRFEIRPVEGSYYGDRELRLGLDWRRMSGTTRENSNFVSGLPTRAREAGGVTETFGGYTELSADFGTISVAASGRMDRWSIRDGRRLESNIGGTVRSDDRFSNRNGWEWTGRLAANWRFSDPVNAKLAVYRGWRLPTLNELYRPFRLGADATAANEALRPERVTGGQLKFESNVDGADIGLTFFYNRLDGAIANVTLGQGPGNFLGVGFVAAGGVYRQRQNLDAIESKGIELDASVDLSEQFTLSLGYAYVDAKVRASGAALALDGLRPAQVPRHFGNASLAFDDGDVSAEATLRYIGRQFEDDANSRVLDDALTADLSLGYALDDRLTLELRGENLFNARVEAAVSGTGIIERASPRTIWFGVRWSLD